MGIFFNPGNEGFKSVVRSKVYIDKTEMLKYTNSVCDTEQRYLCVSRPRRFGKSITAEMLVAYYDKSCDSREIFQPLKIGKSVDFEEHMNKYDVIHIDVNYFRGQSANGLETVEKIQRYVTEELKETYLEGIDKEEWKLPVVLAKINKVYGVKFVIVIDEWDAIFREDKSDVKAQEAYITLLRGLFKDAPSKKFLKLAYMTGILPIKKYGTESALNNFDEFTMVMSDDLAEYVGFTENEVRSLYEEYGMDFEEAKRWYDGYHLTENIHIYNPKSVVDSVRRKRIGNYWTNTGTYESLKSYIGMNFDGLKDAIIEMLAGGKCKVNPQKFQNDMISFKSKDDILTLLIHLGYLAYDMKNGEVSIPNAEVREEYKNAIEDTGWEKVMEAINASEQLLRATWNHDEVAVAKGIDAIHTANTSILSYNNENSLSCVISLAYYNALNEYTLVREIPAGKGYADIVFLPRKYSDKPAMIVELKWNKSAEGAIAQIKSKNYVQALEGYKGEVLLVGINYDKEKKEHQCVIEGITKL